MKKLLTRLSKSRFPYEPLIRVEISKKRLLHNLAQFDKLTPKNLIAPVLKSNAYGHGLIEIATILEKEAEIPFFIVDSYFEAVALQSQGINTPLLIIGYNRPETIYNARLRRVSFTITNLLTLVALSQFPIRHFRRHISIHLKIDTGMHRQGILPEEIPRAIELIKKTPHLSLQGICSHLSDADNSLTAFTEKQIDAWNEIVTHFKKEFTSITYVHLAATDGHAYHKKIEANVSRLGIGLYGITGNQQLNSSFELQPVLELKTIITSVKKLKAGETIGYGNAFTAQHDMNVATIPVGYFEGLDRRLSNKGYVQTGTGRDLCAIVGRISMNITSVDVSHLPDVAVGDEVTVISNNAHDLNSVHSMADLGETIAYEIGVKIPEHLKRVVVE